MALFALLNHKKLEKEMEARNFKQEWFAEQLGITDRHVRNLKERDTNVAVSLLYSISRVLDTPMEDLLILREEDRDP